MAEMRAIVAESCNSDGGVLVLIDLHDAPAQPLATTTVMEQGFRDLSDLAGKVAIICASALLALQLKRALPMPNLGTFHDQRQAKDWLFSAPDRLDEQPGW
jgi:hypothetical protein